jgi:predicted PurR-regulated permease PerM
MKNKLDKEVDKKELNDVITLSKKILQILYIVFIAVIILAGIIALRMLNVFPIILEVLKVVSPFFIGFAFAWLLRPIVLRLNKKINNNTLSSILVFAVFALVLFLILYIFIPTVYEEVNELVGLIPSFIERITNWINDLFANFKDSGLDLEEFKNNLLINLTKYGTGLATEMPTNIINFIISLFSGIGTFVMGLIVGVYMLIDYDNILIHCRKILPLNIQDDAHKLSSRMSTEVRKCVNGTFLVALMVLICDSLGFAIIGLNAPLLFGILCGLTDLIPYIGPYIGGAAAVIVGLTQDPLVGIGALIVCVIVQLVENYILQPIVMSKASSLHPIVIIIALLVFGHFFGIIGMILATPTLTILRVIIEFILEKMKIKLEN